MATTRKIKIEKIKGGKIQKKNLPPFLFMIRQIFLP